MQRQSGGGGIISLSPNRRVFVRFSVYAAFCRGVGVAEPQIPLEMILENHDLFNERLQYAVRYLFVLVKVRVLLQREFEKLDLVLVPSMMVSLRSYPRMLPLP